LIVSVLTRVKLPHVFALIFLVIAFCTVLTYIVPSGSFEREQIVVEGKTRNVVIPGSYTTLEKHISAEIIVFDGEVEGKATPVGFLGFLKAIPKGMESAADVIFFIFLIGGVFGILSKTGVVEAFIHLLLEKIGHNDILLTIVIMSVIAVGGSTLGMSEEFIPLVPIFIMVADRLGYDRIFGLAMVVLAAQVGFAAATTNPFTVGVAQGIAEVQPMSGRGFRIVFLIVCLSITIAYLLRYGQKTKNNPSKSLLAGDKVVLEHGEPIAFTKKHAAIMTTGILVFGGIIYAVAEWSWWMAEMGGGFLLIGIVSAWIAGMNFDEAAKAFAKGMEDMVVAALVVGFARGIEVVMENGMIMDTVIFYATELLQIVPQYVAVLGMLVFQTVLNFFIPSGTGQAAVTMPLMAPIADIIGVTRQTAVFAFQCGDGFSNTVIPTSGVLMAMLALARIPYAKWLQFMLPLFGILMGVAAIFLMIAVAIGYS
jgi:uncharacterized ion transporter superfamily protein YfcC